jgi:hypothetical protein
MDTGLSTPKYLGNLTSTDAWNRAGTATPPASFRQVIR